MIAWVGIDLDGTAAVYDGWKGIEHIGEPVPDVILYIQQLLSYGVEVRIFTARCQEGPAAVLYIENWCLKHIGKILPVTDRKDFGMLFGLDDRMHKICLNTGKCNEGLPEPADVAKQIEWHWSPENPDSPTYVGTPCE